MAVLEVSGMAGAVARKVLKHFDSAFYFRNGGVLFYRITACTKNHKNLDTILLIMDLESAQKNMDGKDHHRRTRRRSTTDVRLTRTHDLPVPPQVQQAAAPSGKGLGCQPTVDSSHYGTRGMPESLCLSMLFPHTPHAPMMSLWGAGAVEVLGDGMVSTARPSS